MPLRRSNYQIFCRGVKIYLQNKNKRHKKSSFGCQATQPKDAGLIDIQARIIFYLIYLIFASFCLLVTWPRFIDANVLTIIFKGSNPGRVLISVESLEPLGAPKGSNLTNRKTNCHLTKRHDAHFLSGVCQTPNKEEVHFDR